MRILCLQILQLKEQIINIINTDSAVMIEKLHNMKESYDDFTDNAPDNLLWRTSPERSIQFDAGRTQGLIPTELADPKCTVCLHVIQEINKIFAQDDTPCQDPIEYCMTRLLEAVHASLIGRLSKP